MMTPAVIPKTVSATVWVDVKYVTFVRDLETISASVIQTCYEEREAYHGLTTTT